MATQQSRKRYYTKTMALDEGESCYCDSGKPFGDCCGSRAKDRPAPSGINIINNFIPHDECKKFVRFCERQKPAALKIGRTLSSGKRREAVDKSVRVTQSIDTGSRQPLLDNTVAQAIHSCIEPAIGQRVEWFEQPHILRYSAGGFYKPHVDAEHFDPEREMWFRVQDRDISLLIYLNDNYEGGSLRFNTLNFEYQPRAGDLVFFPSGHLYRHESVPVKKGVKFAVVSWMSLRGVLKVRESYDVVRIPLAN